MVGKLVMDVQDYGLKITRIILDYMIFYLPCRRLAVISTFNYLLKGSNDEKYKFKKH